MILAFGRPHAESIAAANTKIEFAKRQSEIVRPPPLGEVLRIGPRIKNQIRPSIENPFDNKRSVGRICAVQTNCLPKNRMKLEEPILRIYSKITGPAILKQVCLLIA